MTVLLPLGYAMVVAAVASRALPAAGWAYRSPRLGLAAWYAVIAAIVGSVATALVALIVSWPRMWATMCVWSVWCFRTLRGDHGTAVRLAGWGILVLLLCHVTRLVLATARAGRAIAVHRRRHGRLLARAGRADHELDATVVDDDLPAAYVLPGRGPGVVVTTGAIRHLPPSQLAAVLGHERAHLAGRHHLLLDGVQLATVAVPYTGVLVTAAAQIGRLVEIRADQIAAHLHGRLELARALVFCAEATARRGTPPARLAATGGDALERVNLLLHPPRPLPRPAAAALVPALAAVAIAPLAIALLDLTVIPAWA